MATIAEPSEGLFIRDDDEGLFSRDINGQLVRLDAPTETDYTKTVTVQIDGVAVTVPLAEPLKDSMGNIVIDLEGRTTPKYTTILDAAQKLYVKQPGDEVKIPIPTLCHQPHMKPVGVCRLCVVQIYGQKRGKRAAERKLLPACQHPVKDGMEVFTMRAEGADGDRVRETVKIVTELLTADNLRPAHNADLDKELAPLNELNQMADRCGADRGRFRIDALDHKKRRQIPDPPVGQRKLDATSPVFVVDHNACILCDRCVRACNDVMENNVIGRTGKGASAGIGFDLNDWMGDSGCVQCGECMVSCPTTAITFKPVAKVKSVSLNRRTKVLPASEIIKNPLFAGMPPKFLLWQQGLVLQRKVSRGETIFKQGEAGNTALIMREGLFEVRVYRRVATLLHKIYAFGSMFDRTRAVFKRKLTAEDLIVGEMACVTGTPRTGDVVALKKGEVWEIRRNVVDRLMRLPGLRERFDNEYRQRSLDLVLERTDLFKSIERKEYQEIVDFLRNRIGFVRVQPGQELFKQGDQATNMFLVRLGHVRIGVRRYAEESRLLTAGPGAILGEIGLLGLSREDAALPDDVVDERVRDALEKAGNDLVNSIPAGFRSATCSALGHIELARLGRSDFLEMIRQFPTLRRRLVRQSLARLRNDRDDNPFLKDYVEQGLYEGQSILVLDLERCTRCDECTRGCVDEHGDDSHGVPLTRMLRDGMRFDRYLVATSCRSCTTAHCMVGCPVDAIHRGRHLQIVIEDHCIGCGLCATNCPYGSIALTPNIRNKVLVPDSEHPGNFVKVAQKKAVNCDLCDAEGKHSSPQPKCVASCPHDAAFRMSGEELLQRILGNPL